ncbi:MULTISPECIES: helix-turn-helix domain-containing protein [unclassified Oceanispirochaeta]|uniref:response regulator transcription factor n=1 Tax=unclassified Oceanispirochaeta TaxID=2635722 RepID=UPI000E097CBF|nr:MULTISPECIES: helix-turn-helix domain-containing protein [unclassified Oceanispirochaeta]MBF9014041.1 helix-turn-helix domain-containing protein [Oceanispirochaeta sp. M2]NPD70532.1 helix-turn-helix domain-containing protein [Oceanispirochaeta sp. M1]RDG34299.1 helix-turn-helix domain-containing protein [Oceanispirochaeta sp. M1]
MINIVLADDEPLALYELKTIVPWEEQGFHVTGEFRNGKAVLDFLIDHPGTDLVLLDINMPVMTGLEVIEEWRKREGKTEFIIISAYSDYPLVRRAFQNGACDYILKEDMETAALLPILEKLRKKILTKGGVPIPGEDEKNEALAVKILHYLEAEELPESPIDSLFSCPLSLLMKFEFINCFRHEIPIQDVLLRSLLESLLQEYAYYYILKSGADYYLILPHEADLTDPVHLDVFIKEIKTALKQSLNYSALILSRSGGYENLPGQYKKLKDQHQYKSRGVMQSLQFLRAHYNDPEISLDSLCKKTGLSRNHLSTVFKQEMGLGYKDFLNEIRISHAITLLETTDTQIQEISERCGFSNVEHFSRTFKNRTALSPSHFFRNKSQISGNKIIPES